MSKPTSVSTTGAVEASRPPHARLVATTDGDGAIVGLEAEDPSSTPAGLALSVDLVVAALARLGEARAVGGLRSALLVFDGAVMAIGRGADARNVAVIGDAQATHGLVLSHLNRLLAASAGGGDDR